MHTFQRYRYQSDKHSIPFDSIPFVLAVFLAQRRRLGSGDHGQQLGGSQLARIIQGLERQQRRPPTPELVDVVLDRLPHNHHNGTPKK